MKKNWSRNWELAACHGLMWIPMRQVLSEKMLFVQVFERGKGMSYEAIFERVLEVETLLLGERKLWDRNASIGCRD